MKTLTGLLKEASSRRDLKRLATQLSDDVSASSHHSPRHRVVHTAKHIPRKRPMVKTAAHPDATPEIVDQIAAKILKKHPEYGRSRAYAIAQSTAQKAGYTKPGTDDLTNKGRAKSKAVYGKRRAVDMKKHSSEPEAIFIRQLLHRQQALEKLAFVLAPRLSEEQGKALRAEGLSQKQIMGRVAKDTLLRSGVAIGLPLATLWALTKTPAPISSTAKIFFPHGKGQGFGALKIGALGVGAAILANMIAARIGAIQTSRTKRIGIE